MHYRSQQITLPGRQSIHRPEKQKLPPSSYPGMIVISDIFAMNRSFTIYSFYFADIL